MIKERRKFEKVYDLTERVLPDHVDTHESDDNELGQFLVHTALKAYGIANKKEIQNHIDSGDKNIIEQSLNDLMDAGGLKAKRNPPGIR